MSASVVEEITLRGRFVRLEPLQVQHVDDLVRGGLDPSLWTWMPYAVRSRDDMIWFVSQAIEARVAGSALPFATCLASTGEAVGSTRFLNIVPDHLRTEIGGTWIVPAYQRSAVNTEAKYLMLRHAFESWGFRRVEFKTHASNTRSRAAIARLGAREEGTLRKHMVHQDGSPRDSVYFSILDEDWPTVKLALEARLRSGWHPA